jgi:hypothetical protein
MGGVGNLKEVKLRNDTLENALYTCKGVKGKPIWVVAFIVMLFALIVILIFKFEPNVSVDIVNIATIVCSTIIGASVLGVLIAIIVDMHTWNRINLAVFNDYLLIYALKKRSKRGKYVVIQYIDIIKYSLDEWCDYASEDSAMLFPHYRNYGNLNLNVKENSYQTEIADIATTRKYLIEFVPVSETIKNCGNKI